MFGFYFWFMMWAILLILPFFLHGCQLVKCLSFSTDMRYCLYYMWHFYLIVSIQTYSYNCYWFIMRWGGHVHQKSSVSLGHSVSLSLIVVPLCSVSFKVKILPLELWGCSQERNPDSVVSTPLPQTSTGREESQVEKKKYLLRI